MHDPNFVCQGTKKEELLVFVLSFVAMTAATSLPQSITMVKI